ncbi:DUF7696 family protein [Aquabacterium sp. OR-4]|uniref:DUF7696 family protein n=1 Tax=Aquabacterium sp. OR-4 TaxID=2978127 RepID=UPI0021B1BB84|nr:hypothetical protein [Aquabacterium sp. OR-4]MDT7834978.1 hypothetical protein [Aquabacterium sp. OR-4]
MTTVTLVDGTVVDSASEAWRHECEARAITMLPTLADRRAWLENLERRRGRAAVDALRATMRALWEARKPPT